LQVVTHTVSLASELAKTNSEVLNLAVVTDEFDTGYKTINDKFNISQKSLSASD
jgi:hypothetical protein